jgi:hypothetical protein
LVVLNENCHNCRKYLKFSTCGEGMGKTDEWVIIKKPEL